MKLAIRPITKKQQINVKNRLSIVKKIIIKKDAAITAPKDLFSVNTIKAMQLKYRLTA
ncbi:hypothetical protein JK636_05385 [Clostridium sp. YIM B02515]|uniref:Uncharacterized protein n=1 Tax=Clostridium rhizosphaerae TaxID=2803861 RepID=A0ABS1T7T3_9CLOT|nr:hypothetical protein [Clostridium rhizosphaerae]